MSRKLPLWLTVAMTVAAASIPAGIAWGLGQGKIDELEARLERSDSEEREIRVRLRAIEQKIERALALLEAQR
ncbi:MAG: hypothetical protein VW405_01615 [Rhodospirillaceae bacterium]